MSGHKRAFIHIGLAKTGTTSIQHTLAAGRHNLLKQGILYPRIGALNDRSGHHCLAWAVSGSAKFNDHCSGFGTTGFRNAVTDSAHLHLVVSSEELSTLAYNYSKIRTLLSLFENHETYIVAYVREQTEFFNAFWIELVSDLNYGMTQHDFVHRCLTENRYNYNDWFKAWKSVVGSKLIVRPFDPSFLVNGNVVDDFCSVVEFERPRVADHAEWKNRSMNANQIAATIGLLMSLEKRGVAIDALSPGSRMRVKGLVNRIVQDPELSHGDSYWGIDSHLAECVQEHYRDANRQFFGDHLGEEFAFSAVGRLRPVTAIEYADLDPKLQARLEYELAKGIDQLDGTVPLK